MIPPIHFFIDRDSASMVVGANEVYNIDFWKTEIHQILDDFDLEDFKSNEYFYNPHFRYMAFLEIEKEIDGQNYVRNIASYKRRDIGVEYHNLDSAETSQFAIVSNYLNTLAIMLLQDKADKSKMMTAFSMSEALENPENVYELRLRNSNVSTLGPEVGKLTNLRVLNISGTRIRSIPPEIENCKHLKSILANASSLSKIPSTIGNLKKLRFLNLGACKLSVLPDEIGKLTSLWSLSLGSNQLRSLPKSIANLKNLLMFSIDKNAFNEFPSEVLGLTSVGNLWMHGNNFTKIPREIIQLKALSHLLVDAQEIENIDEIKSLIPDVRIIDETNRR
ncbi:MAG: leucine-rich repeat domain-containing protein [Bacteroidia bacterium]